MIDHQAASVCPYPCPLLLLKKKVPPIPWSPTQKQGFLMDEWGDKFLKICPGHALYATTLWYTEGLFIWVCDLQPSHYGLQEVLVTVGWGFMWRVAAKEKLVTKTSSTGSQFILTYKYMIQMFVWYYYDHHFYSWRQFSSGPVLLSLSFVAGLKSVSLPRCYLQDKQNHVSRYYTRNGEEERVRCLEVLTLVLPGLDTGRFVWICLPQAGQDKPGKAYWKSSEACSALCCATGVLLDSDPWWTSGVLFESLTALATRDLAFSKSLIELSINSCSSLQHPPSKATFKNHFTNKGGHAWKEKIRWTDRLLTRILEQQEFFRPPENYEACKRPCNFKL